MTFSEALSYLESLGESRMRLDLRVSQKLLSVLNHPDKDLDIVLVSGTNGKGSTCAFLSEILKAAEFKVGMFTSPHLESPKERIQINGNVLSDEGFASYVTDLSNLLNKNDLRDVTYFEFFTMLALLAFQNQNVDVAIFEVGLGGRLDSTNTLSRMATITTSIALDHEKILGNMLQEIALEKGAIFRKNTPAILSHQKKEALETLMNLNKNTKAHLLVEGKDYTVKGNSLNFKFESKKGNIGPLPLKQRGDHQIHNAGCAAALAFELQEKGFEIKQKAIEQGLTNARVPGRLEKWTNQNGQEVWVDIAHNSQAINASVAFFLNQNIDSMDVLLGMLQDKEHLAVLDSLFRITRSLMLTLPSSPRAWDPYDMKSKFNQPVKVVSNPETALNELLKSSKQILIIGSSYLVGKIHPLLRIREFEQN